MTVILSFGESLTSPNFPSEASVIFGSIVGAMTTLLILKFSGQMRRELKKASPDTSLNMYPSPPRKPRLTGLRNSTLHPADGTEVVQTLKTW